MLVVVRLGVINHLQACEVPVSDVLFFGVPHAGILYGPQEVFLEGLIHILEECVEPRLEGEPVPGGGLLDDDCACQYLMHRTGVGGFMKVIVDRVVYTVSETVSTRNPSLPPTSVACIDAALEEI